LPEHVSELLDLIIRHVAANLERWHTAAQHGPQSGSLDGRTRDYFGDRREQRGRDASANVKRGAAHDANREQLVGAPRSPQEPNREHGADDDSEEWEGVVQERLRPLHILRFLAQAGTIWRGFYGNN
jgi:hypothetical protein